MTTEYRVYTFRFISSVTDYSDTAEIRVYNGGEDGSYVYIRKLEIRPIYDQLFLQSEKDNNLYYSKLKESITLATTTPYRMIVSHNKYLAESMGKYKISELNGLTIADLNNHFEY